MNSRVTLAANERPAINDVCASELRELLDELAKISMDTSLPPSPGLIELGAAWRSGQLRVASSGGDLPLIDLRAVGAEVQAAAAEADLVLLEGMGRGIETNLEAKLKVNCLNLGMIKHSEVAELLGAKNFDCVCRFKPGVASQKVMSQQVSSNMELKE